VNVAELILKRYLRFAREAAETERAEQNERKLLWVEEHVADDLLLNYGGTELKVHLKGFIDRVDRQGSVYRIFDYKSGSAEKKNVEVKEWDSLVSDPGLDMAFQLLMYVFLLRKRSGEHYAATAGIVPLRKLNAGPVLLKVPGEGEIRALIGAEDLSAFRGILLRILTEIYDPNVPFTQTEDLKVCERCPYVTLCRR